MDIRKKLVNVKDNSTMENGMEKNGSVERSRKLFGREYGAEIVQIGIDIVTTSPFKIDVPSSSKSVGFGA